MPLLSGVIEAAAALAVTVISGLSYPGIALLMAVESANIPLPSEIIMPFSGFLASQGRFDIYIVTLAGAVGCTLGSLLSYYLGYASHETWVRGFVRGPGRFLISEAELELGISWFHRYGEIIIFVSRLLPIVRTFISFPAGVARINLVRFTIFTFLGSLLWCYFLALVGYKLGENWDRVGPIFRQFEYLIAAGVVIAIIWYLVRRGKIARES